MKNKENLKEKKNDLNFLLFYLFRGFRMIAWSMMFFINPADIDTFIIKNTQSGKDTYICA